MSDPYLQLHPAKISFLMSAYQDAACLQLANGNINMWKQLKTVQMAICIKHVWPVFVAIISIYKSRQFLLYYKHMLEATMIHSPACQIRSFKPKAFCVPFQKGWIIPVAKPHRLGVGGWSKGHDKQHKPIWGYIVYLPSLSIYLSIYRSFYLSIYRCICESIYCIYQWIYLYVYRSISIYLSIYQSACLSSCLSRKFHKTNTHCWFIDANTIDLKQWKHR